MLLTIRIRLLVHLHAKRGVVSHDFNDVGKSKPRSNEMRFGGWDTAIGWEAFYCVGEDAKSFEISEPRFVGWNN